MSLKARARAALSWNLWDALHRWREAVEIPGREQALRSGLEQYLAGIGPARRPQGAARHLLEGWFNTDLVPSPGVWALDVTRPLPIGDARLDYIFAEHLVEHIYYEQGTRLWAECFRVLKPGGKVRLATPDLRFLASLYRPDPDEETRRYVDWIVGTCWPQVPRRLPAFAINNCFYNWGHRFLYDEEALSEALARAGFTGFRRCGVGESDDPHLRGLEQHWRDIPEEINRAETLVLEAVRPPAAAETAKSGERG